MPIEQLKNRLNEVKEAMIDQDNLTKFLIPDKRPNFANIQGTNTQAMRLFCRYKKSRVIQKRHVDPVRRIE